MLLRIFTEPQQGASYETLLAVARTSESLGFDAFFRSDHYLSMGSADGHPGPSDAWVNLAGLARDTSTIRLGTLVTSATFRHPGPLAITVAGVDAMSGGRVELGLGAGWYEAEHTAYGIPFPPVVERFERLEEQLALITGLWGTPDGATFTLAGVHYQVTDSPALPKPEQRPGPPIIVGGHGAKWTPRLAATYAAEFNLAFSSLEETGTQFARVRAACSARGGRPTRWPTRRLRPSAAGAPTPRWPPGPGPSAGTPTSCGPTDCAGHPRRWWTSWPPTPGSGPTAPTSRSSTSPTWTTWR